MPLSCTLMFLAGFRPTYGAMIIKVRISLSFGVYPALLLAHVNNTFKNDRVSSADNG